MNSTRLSEEVLPSFLDGMNSSFLQNQRVEFIEKLYEQKIYDHRKRCEPTFNNVELIFEQLHPSYIFSTLKRNFKVINGQLSNSKATEEELIGDYWDYEDLVYFFEFVLTNTCFESFYNFGKSLTTLCHLSAVPFNVGNFLIHKLSNLDCFWCHKNGNQGGSEGIQGWLLCNELKLLEGKVETIGYYQDELIDNEEEEEKIKTLRKLLLLALESKNGVLWGGDLRIFYNRNDFKKIEELKLN